MLAYHFYIDLQNSGGLHSKISDLFLCIQWFIDLYFFSFIVNVNEKKKKNARLYERHTYTRRNIIKTFLRYFKKKTEDPFQ